jgi:dCMP deaminase
MVWWVTERPSWDEWLMGMAELVAGRSTCSRRRVGAVIAADNRVRSIGYNGAASGLPHCVHEADTPCAVAVHAEANAVAYAARAGLPTDGATLYSTDAPCLDCAKLVLNAGIARVVYSRDYRVQDGLDLLLTGGVRIVGLL